MVCAMFQVVVFISSAILLKGYFANASSQEKCAKFYSSSGQSIPPFIEPTGKGHVRATLNEFSFMAAIGWEHNGKISFRCGAVLIDKNYVLGPAYCGMTRSGDQDQPKYIAVGKNNLQSKDVMDDVIEIEKIIVHPNRSRTRSYNDIALFKLKKSVGLKPACLWSHENMDSQGTLLLYDPNRTGYKYLLKIRVEMISNEDCCKMYNTSRYLREGISTSQFCAQEINAEDCRSRSTGPLIIQKRSGNKWIPYVVGMGSLGIGCSIAPTPALYTKISSFQEWLQNSMWPQQ